MQESRTETRELRVGGMDCPSCAEQIERALGELEAVEDVRVDVVGGKVRVRHAEGKLARGDLAGAIRRLGFRVEEAGAPRSVFRVEEMDCADEVRQIEAALADLPGVTQLRFDLLRRRLIVEGTIASAEIQRAVQALGMHARLEGEEGRAPGFWQRRGRLVLTVVSGVLLALGLAFDWLADVPLLSVTLLGASAVAGGWFVAPRAVRAIRHATLDMNFLMVVAAMGAAGIGQWAEGASVLFLFSVAQLLETHSMDRARNAIRALMDLSPTEATVRRVGREQRVNPADVQIDETLVVRPGQKIPLDGVVVTGDSSVNQAAITGESIPVDKQPGAQVFAGSVNEHGLLEVKVTRHAEDTTLARIIHAVEEAQATRAASQSQVDRFARIYTPAVVLTAVMLVLFPPLAGLGSWSEWFYRALALLVIACPCALVISTPVSVVSGLTGAAGRGMLIKGGIFLENLSGVTTVAFDKTGTLTVGRPAVVEVLGLADFDQRDVLRLAAALEQGSEHALGRAIVDAASEQELQVPSASDFQALVGQGVRAAVDGRTYFLGSERLCRQHGISVDAVQETLQRFQQEGKTGILFFDDQQLLGVIALADRIRPEARATVARLRAAGVRRIVMLTGDNQGTARAMAQQAGIDDYRAEMLPEDKVEAVRQWQRDGQRVAFVGDGVNDAPALAAASIGIAMGAAGTDVALETADVALMADDLSKLVMAMRASRKTLNIIRQNIVFAIAVKIVFVVLAIAGWATLWMAVAADMGASLAVIANGLRALRSEDPKM
jgi:Cd2+/Zn2+-exporting ATPase